MMNQPPTFAIVDDEPVPADQASLLINDLSIQRGYGVFDFFKTLNHIPIFMEDHLDRFFRSAAHLRLGIGKSREELRALIDILRQKNNLPDSGIRLTLTGGYSTDGYSLGKPNLVISQQPLSVAITDTFQRTLCLVTYPHHRQMPDVKTIDYLMAIWLQPFIRGNGADDVLYHWDGVLTECPRSNFFIVTAEDTLVTPGRAILSGIIRSKVLELARQQFKTEERDIRMEELLTAKEAFVTSTTKHILPVLKIDDKVIGKGLPHEGKPGIISQWLNQRLYKLVGDECRASLSMSGEKDGK
jgi:branched-chain amino acid aminotransferase